MVKMGFFQALNKFRRKLLPQTGSFFGQFNKSAHACHNAAGVFLSMLEHGGGGAEYFEGLRIIEKNADSIVSEIRGDLEQTFITPIDREDIFSLAGRFDDIVDLIESVGFTIFISGRLISDFPLRLRTDCQILFEDTARLARHLFDMTGNLIPAVEHLCKVERMQGIRDRVHKCERDADRIWREILERKAEFLERGKETAFTGGDVFYLWWIDKVAHNIERGIDRTKELVDQIAGIIDKCA